MGGFSQSISHNITTGVLVIGVCIGAMLAFTVYFFQTRVLGSLVRRLLIEARGEENAKTLKELGANTRFYKYFLGDKSVFRRYVSVLGGVLPRDEENEPDFDTACFYIDEKNVEKCEIRYSRDTKIWLYVVGMLACALVGVALYIALPLILDYINSKL